AAALLTSYATHSCPPRSRRRTMLAPMRPRPTIPICIDVLHIDPATDEPRGAKGIGSYFASDESAMSRRVFIVLTCCLSMLFASRANAYSVLAHEANIDVVWDNAIVPVLKQRFPRATADELANARAYAYGGCVIQDLGYYPFGSHFFSDLLHYVRSGDFVAALIEEASDVNELAFGLGALAHYAADSNGHPLATNRVVPMEYPKLREKFGNRVTYAQSPKSHILVEF